MYKPYFIICKTAISLKYNYIFQIVRNVILLVDTSYLLMSTSVTRRASSLNGILNGTPKCNKLFCQFSYTISVRNSQLNGPVYAMKPAHIKQSPTRRSFSSLKCSRSACHLYNYVKTT